MANTKSITRKAWQDGLMCGIARMVAMIARDYQEPDHAWAYLAETGYTVEDFRAAKVEGRDMRVISKLFRIHQPQK